MSKMEQDANKYTEEQLAETMLDFSGTQSLCIFTKYAQVKC